MDLINSRPTIPVRAGLLGVATILRGISLGEMNEENSTKVLLYAECHQLVLALVASLLVPQVLAEEARPIFSSFGVMISVSGMSAPTP